MRNENNLSNPISDAEMRVLKEWLKCGDQVVTGARLGLSSKTVSSHLTNVRLKVGAQNIIEFIEYCVRRGWVLH